MKENTLSGKEEKPIIAWGITGSGHFLQESIETIERLLSEGYTLDLFLSAAARVVLKMYNLWDRIEKLKKGEDGSNSLRAIYYEEDQRPAFPICAHFNLHKYDLLVLCPITSNSTAKMSVGIADTLITNIFSQMLKGSGTVYCMPTDIVSGEIKTRIPGGDFITIHVDEFNSSTAQSLGKFPNVYLFKNPEEIYRKIHKEYL